MRPAEVSSSVDDGWKGPGRASALQPSAFGLGGGKYGHRRLLVLAREPLKRNAGFIPLV